MDPLHAARMSGAFLYACSIGSRQHQCAVQRGVLLLCAAYVSKHCNEGGWRDESVAGYRYDGCVPLAKVWHCLACSKRRCVLGSAVPVCKYNAPGVFVTCFSPDCHSQRGIDTEWRNTTG